MNSNYVKPTALELPHKHILKVFVAVIHQIGGPF